MIEAILGLFVSVSPGEVFEQIVPHREMRCANVRYWTNGSMMFRIFVDGERMSGVGLFSEVPQDNGDTLLLYRSQVSASKTIDQVAIFYNDDEVLNITVREFQNSSNDPNQPLWGLKRDITCEKLKAN